MRKPTCVSLAWLSLMKGSREKEVFFFPSSFWQHWHVLLKMSLWQNPGPRLQVPVGTYDGEELGQSGNIHLALTTWGFSLPHNLRQGFISFPFQHGPQPFHALTTLQNWFLTARNHLKWEWESLTSSRFLEAKSFRREKQSQGSLGNCSQLWEEEKKERKKNHSNTWHSSFSNDTKCSGYIL